MERRGVTETGRLIDGRIPSLNLSLPHSLPPSFSPSLRVLHAGLLDYDAAVALQEELHAARRAGGIPDTLILLEHPPVITLGRGANAEHLLASREALEARGVPVRETARGGNVTYHGPGQLVGYPIFDLNQHGRDVHLYVRNVEEALIRALASLGIAGERS